MALDLSSHDGAVLGPQQLEEYAERGVLVLRNAVPVETVSSWRNAWEQLKGEIDRGEAPVRRSARFVGGAALPGALGDIYRHPTLVGIARSVWGNDIALYFNRILVKDDTWNGPVAPHQDCVYFHGRTDKLSIFVPLEAFTHATGNVKFVAGSHKFGNLGRKATIQYEAWPQLQVVDPDAQPGDLILASFETWHHSEAALVPCERPMMQIAYQPASDGSYYGEPNEPVLVCGQWRTSHFSRYLYGIEPHG
jgi:hypothetical protein